jgi:hypothetical protein
VAYFKQTQKVTMESYLLVSDHCTLKMPNQVLSHINFIIGLIQTCYILINIIDFGHTKPD